jgi:hypothetical protein
LKLSLSLRLRGFSSFSLLNKEPRLRNAAGVFVLLNFQPLGWLTNLILFFVYLRITKEVMPVLQKLDPMRYDWLQEKVST